MSDKRTFKRGDIYFAELNGDGNQQKGNRPVLIYSNNTNNTFSPILNVIPMSTEFKKLCVHVQVKGCGLKNESTILVEQITTINKFQVKNKIGRLSSKYMDLIDEAIDVQFGRRRKMSNIDDIFGE